MWMSFEALLGRRYLMRSHRKPRLLYIGVFTLALGLFVMLSAHLLQKPATAEWVVSTFTPHLNTMSSTYEVAQLAHLIQIIGLGFIIISVLVSLFGFLSWWMTTFSAFSTFMIATGVAEVLLVLGVMGGFQGYLKQKLISAKAHVSVLPTKDAEWITDYAELTAKLKQLPGVYGVSPVLNAEVMLRSVSAFRSETSVTTAAVTLFGVEPESIDQTITLSEFLECGCMSTLQSPEVFEVLMDAAFLPTAYCQISCESHSELTEELARAVKRTHEIEASQEVAKIDAGGFPSPKRVTATLPIFLGAYLPSNAYLNLGIGDTVEVISPLGDIGPQGPMPKIQSFTFAGWVRSGLTEVDFQHAYVSLRDAQRFVGAGDVVNEIRIRARNIESARALRDQLEAFLGDRARVIDWRDRNNSLFNALQLERLAMFLVLTINIILAAFSIMSTLIMNLVERRREISILRAMGAEARSMRRIFVSQGLTAGVVGSLLGTFIGGGACMLLSYFGLPLGAEQVYNISSIPIHVELTEVVLIVTVALGVSLVSTIYPAHYAAKIQPIEGVKGR